MAEESKTYKIRKFKNGTSAEGREFTNFSLTVPGKIARQLPANMRFTCEVTEEGILFRPCNIESKEPKLPKWAQNGSH